MDMSRWFDSKKDVYTKGLWVFIFLFPWLIAACSNDTINGNNGDSSGIAIPVAISALAIPSDTTSFTASLFLDGDTSPLATTDIATDGSQNTVNFTDLSVPVGTHILTLEFVLTTEAYDALVLASVAHEPIEVSAGTSYALSFDITDYDYPDQDGDGASNLTELNYGSDPTDQSNTPFHFWVDLSNGLDSNSGTERAPFKTITYALTQAGQNKIVKVLPGTYDLSNGETFPLILQPGQSLIGDESSKGESAKSTAIVGYGDYTVGSFSAATLVGAEAARISGFSIGEGPNFHFAIIADGITMDIVNNSFRSSTYGGVYLANSGVSTIRGNIFNTKSYGVYVNNSPDRAKIANNTFITPSLPIDVLGVNTAVNISNNTIIGSGQVGIQVQHGTPLIRGNIFNNADGYRYAAIRAQFTAATPIVRGNTFICDSAISIVNGNPDLGTATKVGNNDFSAVTGVSVRHSGEATVVAIGNLWPATPPVQNMDIVVEGGGKVVWGTGANDFYTSLPTGLAAFFPFRGNALDVSGNNNDGTVNGAVLTTDKDGNSNSAYKVFRGSALGDIKVSHSQSLDLNDFTLVTWFNMEAVTDAFSVLIGKDYSTGYAIGIGSGGSGACPAPGNVQRVMRVYVGDQAYNFSLSDFACSTWYHVAVSYDNSTGDVQLFINGRPADRGTVTAGSMKSNTYDLGIGTDGRWGDHFNGTMDQVYVFNRVLTGTEINAIYSQ